MEAKHSVEMTQNEAYQLNSDIEELLRLAKKSETYAGWFGHILSPPAVQRLLLALVEIAGD